MPQPLPDAFDRIVSQNDFSEDELRSLVLFLHRRRFISGAVAAALLGGLPVNAHDTQDASPVSGWTFTDDMGVTVTLPEKPRRIVAALIVGASLQDFGVTPVGVIGPLTLGDGTPSPAAGNLDPEQTVSITVGDRGPDLEELLLLEPDLIVTSVLRPAEDAEPGPAGFLPETLDIVEGIAPILAFDNTNTSVSSIIARLDELTASIVDERPAAYLEARGAFPAAEAAVREALAGKPNLSAMGIAGNEHGFHVMNPGYWSDLSYLQELGMQFVQPDATEWYWETMSWEDSRKYSADFLLNDPYQYSLEQLAEQPSMQFQPAFVAGQIVDRPLYSIWSYQGYLPILQEMAELISTLDEDVVDESQS